MTPFSVRDEFEIAHKLALLEYVCVCLCMCQALALFIDNLCKFYISRL